MPQQRKIVTVCSGNICRSPMAEVILKKLLEDRDDPSTVDSCGTLRIRGAPAAPNAVAVCKELGIDLSQHRSKEIRKRVLEDAEAIIVMEPIHETVVRKLVPEANVFRLWEFTTPGRDHIYDPVGQDLETFRRCRDELISALTCWINRCW